MKSLPPETRAVAEYQRIEEDLRKRIRSGHWGVGAMLPSRRDLARQYSVSAATMERAVTPLIADGTVRSDDRRGTFVARLADRVASQSPTKSSEGIESAPNEPSGYGAGGGAVKPITIGVIALMQVHDEPYVVDQNAGWVRLIVQSMEEAFSADGKTTIFFNRARGHGQPIVALGEAICSARENSVDALAIVSFDLLPAEVDEALGALGPRRMPVVCALAGELTRPVPHVFYDNSGAGYQAAHHLLNLGHKRITVFAPFDAPWVRERLDGIRAAVAHAGHGGPALDIRFNQQTEWFHDIDPGVAGYGAVQLALEESWAPGDALICVSDGVAFGVLRALSEVGRESGVDFAMVGFDDAPEARDYRLTSMRPPMAAMGREAARLLLLGMHGEPVNTQVRLRAHLIPRGSTGFKPTYQEA